MKLFSLLCVFPFVAYAACGLTMNASQEYEVGTFEDLQKVGIEDCSLDAKYRMTDDITVPESDDEWHGFPPIGDFASDGFSGEFHGAGHRIINLELYNDNYEGFFGHSMNGLVDSLGLENIFVNGGYYTGGVVGYGGSGTISNVYVTGTIQFMGYKPEESYMGGIAGSFAGKIENCYFNGTIGSTYNIGGIVGLNEGTVKTSYAINTGTLNMSYQVGKMNLGAVVGVNEKSGSVENSYGMAYIEEKVIGKNLGAVDSNSAYTKGFDYNYNLEMKFKDFYVGFDFEKVWEINEKKTEPFLRAMLKPARVTPVWYAKEYCTGKAVGPGMSLMPEGLNENNYGGKFGVKEVNGKMVVDLSNVHALNQNGYAFVSDTLDIPIQPLEITVTGLTANDKVYDGEVNTEILGTAELDGVCEDDDVALKGSVKGEFADAKIGKNKKVKISGLSLEGDSLVLANYRLVLPELSASIIADTTEKENSIDTEDKDDEDDGVDADTADQAIVRTLLEIPEGAPKILFDGHSVLVGKNGMTFDLQGNRKF